jgi:hypothetical protein
MNHDNPLGRFNPRRLGYYEKENWVAYYQKRWLKLLRVSVAMVQEAFALSFWQAVYAAYLVGRAEMAAAPFPDNDIPTAERYMRRFYSFINRVHHLDLDVDQAARREVNWWVIHRQLFGQAENQPLVEALTELYVCAYRIEPEQARAAADHRAQAMYFSDRWIKDGKADGSNWLAREEEALVRSYSLLKAALAG